MDKENMKMMQQEVNGNANSSLKYSTAAWSKVDSEANSSSGSYSHHRLRQQAATIRRDLQQ
jgi:hypothetical protein